MKQKQAGRNKKVEEEKIYRCGLAALCTSAMLQSQGSMEQQQSRGKGSEKERSKLLSCDWWVWGLWAQWLQRREKDAQNESNC